MKSYGYIFFTLCLSSAVNATSDFPSKFTMKCKAATFDFEIDLSKSLTEGQIRSLNPFLASFADSDSYSTRESYECTESKNKDECVSNNNNISCTNPLPSFKVKSIKSNNSMLMVQNRCNGGYIKFIKSEPDRDVYMEDRMHFNKKNQIHATEDSVSLDKPLLIFTKQDGDIILSIDSQSAWLIGDVVETRRPFSAERAVPVGLYDRYTLSTTCKESD
jgi:hypothetical protein